MEVGQGVEHRARREGGDDQAVRGVGVFGEMDARLGQGATDGPGVLAFVGEAGGVEGLLLQGLFDGLAGVVEAREAFVVVLAQWLAFERVARAAQFGEPLGKALQGALFAGDPGASADVVFAEEVSFSVGRGAFDDDALVAREQAEHAVVVAIGGCFLVENAEPGAEADVPSGGDEAGAQVWLFGEVEEVGVVPTGVDEGLLADGCAAADEDLGQSASLARAVGQCDIGHDGGGGGGCLCQDVEVSQVSWSAVVVEHDQPIVAGVCGGVVARGGGDVGLERDHTHGDGRRRQALADGCVRGVVGDDDFDALWVVSVQRVEAADGVGQFARTVAGAGDVGDGCGHDAANGRAWCRVSR